MDVQKKYNTVKIPIEIVNIILGYVGDINELVVYMCYDQLTCQEKYKINFTSDFLWRLKSVMIMKRLYPIYIEPRNFNNIQLYDYGVRHYENLLRNNILC